MQFVFTNFNEDKYTFDGESLGIYKGYITEYPDINSVSKVDLYRTQYFSHLALIMNNECNMACTYCYAEQGHFDKAGLKINISHAKKMLDLMVKNVIEHRGYSMGITFFGGEPLISFDKIKEIVEYTEMISETITKRYTIVTNGTLMNDEIADFMEKYHFRVTVSLDGDKTIHDAYRFFASGCGSYDMVKENYQKYNSKIQAICRITIHNGNTDVFSDVKNAVDIGFRNIAIGFDSKMSDDKFRDFYSAYNRMLMAYYEDIQKGNFYVIESIKRNINNLLFQRRISSRCNAGRAYFTLAADGSIYDCHRVVGIKELKVAQDEDNLKTLIDDHIQFINKKVTEKKSDRHSKCNFCPFVYLCGGTCYQHSYEKTGSYFSRIERDCSISKLEIEFTLKMVTSLDKTTLKEFITYCNKKD